MLILNSCTILQSRDQYPRRNISQKKPKPTICKKKEPLMKCILKEKSIPKIFKIHTSQGKVQLELIYPSPRKPKSAILKKFQGPFHPKNKKKSKVHFKFATS